MVHDKPYWQAEIDSLRAELIRAGLEETAAIRAAHLVSNIGTSPVDDISAMIGIYACMGFASGQLGDMERLNRYIAEYS
jgi:hypothetical protein